MLSHPRSIGGRRGLQWHRRERLALSPWWWWSAGSLSPSLRGAPVTSPALRGAPVNSPALWLNSPCPTSAPACQRGWCSNPCCMGRHAQGRRVHVRGVAFIQSSCGAHWGVAGAGCTASLCVCTTSNPEWTSRMSLDPQHWTPVNAVVDTTPGQDRAPHSPPHDHCMCLAGRFLADKHLGRGYIRQRDGKQGGLACWPPAHTVGHRTAAGAEGGKGGALLY